MPFVLETYAVIIALPFLLIWLIWLRWERTVINKRDNLALTAEAEVENLKQQTATSSNSLWKMRKEELVKAAREELGLSPEEANAETAVSLREKIRTVRKFRDSLRDPQAATPPGLCSMTKAELRAAIQNRGLKVDMKETRDEMKRRIREDARDRMIQSEAFIEDYESIPASTPKTKASFPSRR